MSELHIHEPEGSGMSPDPTEVMRAHKAERTKKEYRDVLMKARHYKELAVMELAKFGQLLSDEAIKDRLQTFDMYLPIFRHDDVLEDSRFDANRLTRDISNIHDDLSIMYELLYDLSIKELQQLRTYVESHLREMENEARRYTARIDIEVNSSSMGDTVFYKDGPFPWYTKDNYFYADLGTAKMKEGSLLGLLASGISVTGDNVLVGVLHGDDLHYIAPYNLRNDVYEVPGEKQVKTYQIKYDESAKLDDTFELAHKDLQPKMESTYVGYTGKGKILLTQNYERQHIARSEDYAFHVDQLWEVSFYIKNGTYARFEFSREIENKNFKGIEITNLGDVRRILMRDDHQFAFNIHTDGEIWAEQRICSVSENRLHLPGGSLSHDFLVEEYVPGKEIEVELFLRTKSSQLEYPSIDSIALKELLEMEVMNNDLL